MRTIVFLFRRGIAVLLVLLVVWLVAGFIFYAFRQPFGAGVLLLVFGLIGGVIFLFWAVFKVFGGLVRFIAGPARQKKRTAGLGSEYEAMIEAQAPRRRRRRR